MQTTTNYGYNVPESGDPADISKISENFNKIDTDLKSVSDAAITGSADLAEKIDVVGTKVDGVEDKVDTLTTKVDNINSSVEGLPASLETDFTEVKDAISDVKIDVSEVKTAVDEIPTSLDADFTEVNQNIKELSKKQPSFFDSSSFSIIRQKVSAGGSNPNPIVYEINRASGRLDYLSFTIGYNHKLVLTIDDEVYEIIYPNISNISRCSIVSRESPLVIIGGVESQVDDIYYGLIGIPRSSLTDPYNIYSPMVTSGIFSKAGFSTKMNSSLTGTFTPNKSVTLLGSSGSSYFVGFVSDNIVFKNSFKIEFQAEGKEAKNWDIMGAISIYTE